MKEGALLKAALVDPGWAAFFGGYRWNRLAGLKDIRSGDGLSVTSYG